MAIRIFSSPDSRRRVQDAGQHQDVDSADARALENAGRCLERRAGCHDVIDQDHSAPSHDSDATLFDRKGAAHVLPTLGDGKMTLRRRGAISDQEIRHEQAFSLPRPV